MNKTFRFIAATHRPQHPQVAKSVTRSKLTRMAGLVLALVLGYLGAAQAALINVLNGPGHFAIHLGVSTAGATTMPLLDAPYAFYTRRPRFELQHGSDQGPLQFSQRIPELAGYLPDQVDGRHCAGSTPDIVYCHFLKRGSGLEPPKQLNK